MFPALKFWMLTKFDFSANKGVLVVKFAFANAILKIETLRMRRRFARVFLHNLVPRAQVPFGQHQDTELWNSQQVRSQSLRGFCF